MLTITLNIFAQSEQVNSISKDYKKNNLSVELLGGSIPIGLSYERIISPKYGFQISQGVLFEIMPFEFLDLSNTTLTFRRFFRRFEDEKLNFSVGIGLVSFDHIGFSHYKDFAVNVPFEIRKNFRTFSMGLEVGPLFYYSSRSTMFSSKGWHPLPYAGLRLGKSF